MKKSFTIIMVLCCLLFMSACVSSKNQNQVLNGMIYDFDNEPVSGAAIYINDVLSSYSDIDGHFTISKDGTPGENCRKEISTMESSDTAKQTLAFYSTDITTAFLLGDDYKGPKLADFTKLQQQFLSIVPGDVIFYGENNSDGMYEGHHIGEIAYVDYTMIRNATTINQLLQSITVIECVFNGEVNYVIKRSMFATGSETNPLTVTTNKRGSWQFQNIPTQGSISVDNLRNWEIRRLNSN